MKSKKELTLKDLKKDMLITNNNDDVATVISINKSNNEILLRIEPNIGYTYHTISKKDPIYAR
jgi:hypothetical protein